MPRARLDDDAIAQALASTLPLWTHDGERLTRTFAFASFADALRFVNAVAAHAEAARHHPDIDIRYTKVTLAYWSHDVGGITKSDVKAAASVDALLEAAGT